MIKRNNIINNNMFSINNILRQQTLRRFFLQNLIENNKIIYKDKLFSIEKTQKKFYINTYIVEANVEQMLLFTHINMNYTYEPPTNICFSMDNNHWHKNSYYWRPILPLNKTKSFGIPLICKKYNMELTTFEYTLPSIIIN